MYKLQMKQLPRLLTAVVLLSTVSACGPQEPLRTVSDICLIVSRITVNPHPSATEQSDPNNLYDTDETVNQVLPHNEVMDRVCPKATDR